MAAGKPNKSKPVDYQAMQQELEELLANLQSGQLSIDEALKAYERGMTIIKELEKYLGQTENQVKKLKERFTD